MRDLVNKEKKFFCFRLASVESSKTYWQGEKNTKMVFFLEKSWRFEVFLCLVKCLRLRKMSIDFRVHKNMRIDFSIKFFYEFLCGAYQIFGALVVDHKSLLRNFCQFTFSLS